MRMSSVGCMVVSGCTYWCKRARLLACACVMTVARAREETLAAAAKKDRAWGIRNVLWEHVGVFLMNLSEEKQLARAAFSGNSGESGKVDSISLVGTGCSGGQLLDACSSLLLRRATPYICLGGAY